MDGVEQRDPEAAADGVFEQHLVIGAEQPCGAIPGVVVE
jgi:hypothetical protein